MEIVREPKGIDFIIDSKAMTSQEKKELSDFVKERKERLKGLQRVKSEEGNVS